MSVVKLEIANSNKNNNVVKSVVKLGGFQVKLGGFQEAQSLQLTSTHVKSFYFVYILFFLMSVFYMCLSTMLGAFIDP